MRTIRIFAALILFAGAGLSGRALYLHAKAQLAGVLIRRAWDQSIRSGQPHKPWSWADTHPVARLRIPRLGYDEIVLEGATARTLAFGPARVMSGSALGEPGNLVLAGHRTSWFRPLEGIAQGDTITLDWVDTAGKTHQRTYTVETIRVVKPEAVAQMRPTEQDSLTLITCYPFGKRPTSPQRFVVQAIPVGSESLVASSK